MYIYTPPHAPSLRSRIDASLARMKELTEKAPAAVEKWNRDGYEAAAKHMVVKGLPYEGYVSKFCRLLLSQAEFDVTDARKPPETLYASSHIGRAGRNGIAELAGDDPADLTNATLAEHRLRQIEKGVQNAWPRGLKRPAANTMDLNALLCAWSTNGCPKRCRAYPQMNAALVL